MKHYRVFINNLIEELEKINFKKIFNLNKIYFISIFIKIF